MIWPLGRDWPRLYPFKSAERKNAPPHSSRVCECGSLCAGVKWIYNEIVPLQLNERRKRTEKPTQTSLRLFGVIGRLFCCFTLVLEPFNLGICAPISRNYSIFFWTVPNCNVIYKLQENEDFFESVCWYLLLY